MNVFAFTRIKLTVLYVLAVLFVSLMFSFVLYRGVAYNLEQSFIRAENRLRGVPAQGQQLLNLPSQIENKYELHQLFLDELVDSKRKVIIHLLFTNVLILLASSLVSYMVAGKTLRPIEKAVIEQKRFIADASHELRTPLTSLKTAIEVAMRDETLEGKSKKILADNLADVNSLQDLVNSLLQLASQENKTIVKQLIDIHEVLSKVTKTIKPLAAEKKIKLLGKFKHQQILASETSLVQLFTILLDNAVKYTNPGGQVCITVNPGKKNIKIQISDTGIGIHKKYLHNIFDRFYRIDESRTHSQKQGFGLGLSVAQQIVENHKGTLTAKSAVGKGSTFTVRLPL